VKKRVQEVMWKKASVIRSQQSLTDAQEELARLEEEDLRKIYGKKPPKIMEAIEVHNLFVVASLVIEAALARKESRGAHCRIDYPKQDDEKWLKHIILTKRHEGVKVDACPVIMTKLFP